AGLRAPVAAVRDPPGQPGACRVGHPRPAPQRLVQVGVAVDEPGHHQPAGGVLGVRGGARRLPRAGDRGDPPVADQHIGQAVAPPQVRAAEQQVVHGCPPRRSRASARGIVLVPGCASPTQRGRKAPPGTRSSFRVLLALFLAGPPPREQCTVRRAGRSLLVLPRAGALPARSARGTGGGPRGAPPAPRRAPGRRFTEGSGRRLPGGGGGGAGGAVRTGPRWNAPPPARPRVDPGAAASTGRRFERSPRYVVRPGGAAPAPAGGRSARPARRRARGAALRCNGRPEPPSSIGRRRRGRRGIGPPSPAEGGAGPGLLAGQNPVSAPGRPGSHFAPASRRIPAISSAPAASAWASGVVPSRAASSGSAPAASRTRTTSWWSGPPSPRITASSRPVQPRSLTWSTSTSVRRSTSRT